MWRVVPLARGMSALHERYRRAERLMPYGVEKLVFRTSVVAQWIGDTDRFWYRVHTRDGAEFVLVDPERGTRVLAFDHARLAAALSTASGTPCDPGALPFTTIALDANAHTLDFDAHGGRWRCDLATYACVRTGDTAKAPDPNELLSPDGRWAALVRDGDLYVRDTASGEERRLTDDATDGVAYATTTDTGGAGLVMRKLGAPQPPVALWSPDSTRLLTHRLDQSAVPWLHMVESGTHEAHPRPVLHSLRYPMPGDPLHACALLVFDVAAGTRVAIPDSHHEVAIWTLVQTGRAWWGDDDVWFVTSARGDRSMTLGRWDGADTRTVITESADSQVSPAPVIGATPAIKVLAKGTEVVWLSERDGWAHLYLVDAATGDVKRQLTRGTWRIREIVSVDEDERCVYVLGGGRQDGRSPYLRHLYRVHLDEDVIELLSPEDADHAVVASPSGMYFVDTFSRVDVAPSTVVRADDGQVVVRLEEADVELLEAGGFRPPEPFVAKAADGVTDVHGVLYLPTDFDPSRRYPVLDSIYPGPQLPRSVTCGYAMDALGNAGAMAELGFAVVVVDGRGTALRSKVLQDASYRNIGCAGYLEDHVTVIRQLADRHPFIDLDRVGIYGHSAGGYAAARALLTYPKFFKAAVASAGNHDQASYYAVWGETYHGLVDDADFSAQANRGLADRLEGKLLLVHGELDDNVHPGLTMQLVRALMEADKDFEMLTVPGAGHSFGRFQPYFLKRQWDFLVRHVLGEEPPGDYRLSSDAARPVALT